MATGLIIIIAIISIFIFYVIFKPYFIKHQTCELYTGTMGTGKTLNAVKTGLKIYKKTLIEIKIKNWWIKLKNKIRTKHNEKVHIFNNKHKYDAKPRMHKKWQLEELHIEPKLISNIPILISKKKGKLKFSTILTKEMLTLDKKGFIPEYSVVIIDEISQLCSQFNWNESKVQHEMNELIQLFRHYTGGYLILTAQSNDEVVKQIRAKMGTYYQLFDFKKIFFFFYKCTVVQFLAGEQIMGANQTWVEDNTKNIYGTLFTRIYDSRCYSERYKKLKPSQQEIENGYYKRFGQYKTNKIIHMEENYISPLDPQKDEH